ncbi:MAG: AAA family ATPase [Elusimicrobiota bacterium]
MKLPRIAGKPLALLLSAILLLGPGASAWANVASVSLPQAPVAPGQAGMAGVAMTKVVDLKLGDMPISITPALGGVNANLLAPKVSPVLTPTLGQAQAVALEPQTLQAVQAAGSAQAVERHPVIGILNALQRSGVSLPDSLSTPQDLAKLQAAAEALPDGKAKQDLLAFAKALSLPDNAAQGAGLAQAFDNSSLMPAAEAASATGFWAKLSQSRLVPSGLKKYAADKAEAQRKKAPLIDTAKLQVPAEKMRWAPQESELPETTKAVDAKGPLIVGQDRALKALKFGLKMPGRGYNVIAVGEDGTGRETAIRALLSRLAPQMATPDDMVAVTNVQDKDKPIVLRLAPGQGQAYKEGVKGLVEGLKKALPEMMNSGQLAEAQKGMVEEFKKEAREQQKALDAEVAKVSIRGEFGLKVEIRQVDEERVAVVALLTKGGQAVKPEDIDSLIEGKGYTRQELESEMQEAAAPFVEKYGEMLQAQQKQMAEIQEKLGAMVGQVAGMLVQQLGAPLLKIASGQSVQTPEMKAFQQKAEAMQAAFEEELSKVRVGGALGLAFNMTPQGLGLMLTYEGQPVDEEGFNQLKAQGIVAKDADWTLIQREAFTAAQPFIEKFKTMMSALQAEAKALKKKTPPPTQSQMQAVAYTQALLQDVSSAFPLFLSQGQEGVPDASERYLVSVLADNGGRKGAPVIFEKNPNFSNLFGSADDNAKTLMVPGAGMVKQEGIGGPTLNSGAYLKANGGFLVLDLMDVLREPNVYPALSRMIRTGQAEITGGGPMAALLGAGGGETYQVPAEVKVVLIASPMLRMMLEHYDEDFAGMFKAVAEFQSSLEIASDTIAYYVRTMKRMIELSSGKMMDLTRGAIAAVLEFAARMAESNEKVSTRFGPIRDLLREASYYAKQAGHSQIGRDDVDRAVAERQVRTGGMRERVHSYYNKGIFTLQIEGSAVGQINGLAVMGDFGVPMRITVRTSANGGGPTFVSADQRAGSTGSSFNKALEVLEGFFEGLFGQKRPIPAKFRISFEQNYGGIDGDSATQTQIYAALSSLAEVPIKQGISITGSADQFGNVQAIGGVNHKIEGYFDVVTAKLKSQGKEMTGEQGVIIPESNVGDLALRPDIVEAVKAGKFHIWAVKHVSQGVEILTGLPYSEVLLKANARLNGFGGGMRRK